MKFILVVIDLLRLIHVAGRDTTNVFSTCGCIKAEGDVSNVAEGFKSHLIRLIGNLCYKNKDNQDKVRLFLSMYHTYIASFRIQYLEFRIHLLFCNQSLRCLESSLRYMYMYIFPQINVICNICLY